MKLIATLITIAFIALLLRWSRERNARVSWAMLIPMVWFAIVCSRPVTQWIQGDQGGNYMQRYSESSPLDATLYTLLLVAGLLVVNRRMLRLKALLTANWAVLLFFFYTAVSVSWSDEPAVGFKRWIKSLGDLVVILVILTEEDHEAAIRRMYTMVAAVLLPLSVLFILYYPSLGTLYDPVVKVTTYTGVATFKNLLGITCMACGLAALWSLIVCWQHDEGPDRKRHLFVHGVNFVLSLGLVLRADSMTSFSSLALAGVVLAAASTEWVHRRPGVVAGLIVAVIAVAGFALFLDSGGEMVKELGRNPTLTGRTMIWRAVLAQHSNPIVGDGFESFWMGDRMQSVWSMSQQGIQEAHDGYLELYLNLGWVGIALLGTMIVTGYRYGFALYRRDAEAGRLRLALLTAAIVFGYTEAGFRMMSPDWIGFLLGVMAIPAGLEQAAQKLPALAREQERQHREVRVLY
jgi:exopolysaccharide production protein ExoQ